MNSGSYFSALTPILAACAFLAATSADVRGQTAQASDAPAAPRSDQVVRMDQFEVVTTEGHGYVATNASEAFKTSSSLMDIPQIDVVVTNDLIRDIGFENLSDTLNYFGVYESYESDGVKLRGGGSATQLYVDEFPIHAGWTDNAVIDSVELIKGGAEGLYMLNSGLGGIVMKSLKKPLPYQRDSISVWADQYGLYRVGIDSTGPIGKVGEVAISYRLIAAYQNGRSYFSNIVDDRKMLYPFLQGTYKNTTVRFHFNGDNVFGSQQGEEMTTPSGTLWTGAGRNISNQPPNNGQRLWTDAWEGTLLQRFSDNWEMRLSGQYFYQGYFGPQIYPSGYYWAGLDEYYTAREDDQRWKYWTALSDLTGHYVLGPPNWEMKNTDIIGWAFTDQVTEKYIFTTSTVPFSDSVLGIPLLPGQSKTTFAVPMASAAAINAMVVPPLSTFYQPSSGAGSHVTIWNGGFYWQHTISLVPKWFDLVVGGSWVSVISDSVNDVSQVPWSAVETHFDQWVHRIAGIVHLGDEISLYALSATNFSPPSTPAELESGAFIPPQEGKDNEIGMKTALLGGRVSTDFSWFELTTTNVPEPAGIFGNGLQYDVLSGGAVEEGVDGDVAFSILPGWQLAGSFFAGHDRDQNNNPVSGTWDNSWGFFTRYDFSKATSLKGLMIGAGMVRLGGRWISTTGLTGVVLPASGVIKVQTGTMVNATVRYAFNKHLDLSVYCANVLNQVYPLATQNLYQTDPSPPRKFSFEMDYKF